MTIDMKSDPTVMREVKRYMRVVLPQDTKVASHVDAWIETPEALCSKVPQPVASHVDAWIETQLVLTGENRLSRIPRGCVD